MKKKEIYEEILDFMNSDIMEGNAIVEELDSWNGYLGEDKVYDIDMIDDILCGRKPSEILNMIGSWDSSDRYFYFDCLGNLYSTYYCDYSDYFDDYLIGAVVDNWNNLWTEGFAPKLRELFELLVNGEYEEDEED